MQRSILVFEQSIKSPTTSVVLAKHVWKTNEKARNEGIAAILCKLGL